MLGFRALLIIGSIVVLSSVAGMATWKIKKGVVSTEQANGIFVANHITMPINISGNGTIESVQNKDLVCPCEGQNTIRTILAEGTTVKAGDVICELDTSTINKELQQVLLLTKKCESDVTWAKQELSIQTSKNSASLESAQVELRLAELSLREYVEGTYPQKLSEATKDVEIAKRALNRKQQELLETRALHVRGFATAADIEKDEQELAERENALDKKTTELKVLTQFTYEKEVADKQDKLSQAKNKLERVKSENSSQMAQKEADLATKAQTWEINKNQLEHWQKQLQESTIKAPIDGIVVYGSSVERFMREQPIGPGSRVFEQQLIVRIPDTTTMKAKLPVGENQVFKLQDAESKKYRAQITVPGLPNPVKGTVKRVSVLPDNQQMWWDPDKKNYPVEIELDETPAGLKPGMNAQIKVSLRVLENVIGVPASALYTEGTQSYVFVNNDRGARPIAVRVGDSNETHIQIVEGLQGGENLWLLGPGQGRRLLEAAGISQKAAPATKPAENPREVAPIAAPLATPA
jgi:HlyD family secretion protein